MSDPKGRLPFGRRVEPAKPETFFGSRAKAPPETTEEWEAWHRKVVAAR